MQRLAQKHGWEKGPLTSARVQRMGVQEYEFHQAFNKAELEKALDAPRIEAESKRTAETEKVQRQWEDKATPEEHETAKKEVAKFVARHPQFKADLMENRTRLVDFLKASNLPITEQTLTDAFQTLGREGKLVLSPSKVGIVRIKLSNGQVLDVRKEDLRVHQRRDTNLIVFEAEDVTGARLSRHALLDVLLSPHSAAIQEKREQAAVSAKDYYKEHSELHETRVPTLVTSRLKQYVATLADKHPEMLQNESNATKLNAYLAENQLSLTLNNLEVAYSALRQAEEIELRNDAVASVPGYKLVDYGPQERGLQLPEKESLARKVNSMSAKEFQEWLQTPSNRRALDGAVAAR